MRTSQSLRPIARAAVFALVSAAVLMGLIGSSPSVRAGTPTLQILSPAENALVGNGTPVSIVFLVSDFNLTAPGSAGAGPASNEGYVDVYVNGNLTASVDQENVVLPLPSGIYRIVLRLVLANGTAVSPEVSAARTVTVTQGPATGTPRIEVTFVEITLPTPGVVLNDDVTVSFRVTDFALVPPIHNVSVPNEGHVVVYLDGRYYQAITSYGPAFFSDLADGDHNVTMQLVDDSGHPLTPAASSSVVFRIQASAVVDISPYLLDAQYVLAVAILVVLFYRGKALSRVAGLASHVRREKP